MDPRNMYDVPATHVPTTYTEVDDRFQYKLPVVVSNVPFLYAYTATGLPVVDPEYTTVA